MEMHFPNHIPPTTYSPAAVTGRLRSLDQPEEANLSSEGAGQANGSTKNQRWAAESGHRSPPTPELPPLPGPFPPAHTSHIRHTPLRGARRPQRPVPSLPLALWRQTGKQVGRQHALCPPWPTARGQPQSLTPEGSRGEGNGHGHWPSPPAGGLDPSQSESSWESAHWPNAAAQRHWMFQNGGLFCLGLWIQFILNLIDFLKTRNSDEPAARNVSSLTSHWPPKSINIKHNADNSAVFSPQDTSHDAVASLFPLVSSTLISLLILS